MTPFARRVEEVFDEAMALTGVERARCLDVACAGDAALRREVETLLDHDARPGRAPDELVKTVLADAIAMAATMPVELGGSELPQHSDAPSFIAHFEVTGKLGEGGMGVVYEAKDPRLGRTVAVKVVRFGGDAMRARLLREAQAMAKVAHPNVVTVHEVGAVGDELFIAMELVRGETLRAWLARTERSWRDTLAMFVETGRGLAAAHEAGIIHRDFKPDNVLVGVDGRPRVLDFGLARAGSETVEGKSETHTSGGLDIALTAPQTLMGTPAFMSPEQFEGLPLDARTDQFSFAVALHTALYGKAPFAGETVGEIRESVLSGARQKPLSSSVPQEVESAIARALSHEKPLRFADMRDLLAELERPLAPEAENDPARGRNKRRIAAALLCAAAGASFAGAGRTEALGFTPLGIVGLALTAAVALGIVGVVFRKTLLATRYNRRVGFLFSVLVVALLVHRLLAFELDAPVLQTFVGDGVLLALTSALGAVTLDRWMGWGVLVALAYAQAAVMWPALAAPGFGALLMIDAAATVLFWRDSGSKKKDRNEVSGNASELRTTNEPNARRTS